MTSAGTGKLLVVTGPSGVGKSTITSEVLERTNVRFSVSVTTRSPRPDEVDGRHYCFVDNTKFMKMVEQDELLEWAEVFGNYYGTPEEPVRRMVASGGKLLLEIDVRGGIQVHEKMPDADFVLVEPPSIEELRLRLDTRGTEDKESLAVRLGKAEEELRMARESGIYNYRIVNDDLDVAIEELIKIVEA